MTQVTVQPSHRRKWLKRGVVSFGAVLVVTGIFLWYIGVLGRNFRTVEAGKCYRSAQLKPAAIKAAIAENGLKSVVNLRGARKNSDWYVGEIQTCIESQVDHADINIGLGSLPDPDALKQLIEKLEAGPYPMLMHCRAGADRSSLGAVFYVHLVGKKPLAQAEAEQMTWRYGHFGIGEAKYIDNFFELYHRTSNALGLKE